MHKVADAITAPVRVPFLHIADPTAFAIRKTHAKRIALLGTRFTMEEDFYVRRLADPGRATDGERVTSAFAVMELASLLEKGAMQAQRSLLSRLLRLAGPVTLARLGIMGMGLTDVIVVGQLAPAELPHQALGWAPTGVMTVTGIGLLQGVQVLAARALGEQKPEQAGGAWRRGMVVAGVAGMLACALSWWVGSAVFQAFGIAPRLAVPAANVMKVLALSVPLHLAYVASAFFSEAIQQPMASTVIMWLANGVNLALNLLLVPKYGAVGSAYATVGARGFLAVSLSAWLLFARDAKTYGTRSNHDAPKYSALLRVGAAAALSQAAEAGAFSGMTVIAGRLGEQAVAGYQVCLNLLAVLFMVALGVAAATAVLTSEAVGRARYDEATRASFMGLKVIVLFMFGAGALVVVAASSIARLYTADAELVLILAALLPWTALAVVPDAAQAVAASALRAQGDNWAPTASHVFAYALVMPALGLYLAEHEALGVRGLLIAVTLASVLSAAVLVLRLKVVSAAPRASALA